jgi:hypothetical protein
MQELSTEPDISMSECGAHDTSCMSSLCATSVRVAFQLQFSTTSSAFKLSGRASPVGFHRINSPPSACHHTPIQTHPRLSPSATVRPTVHAHEANDER